MNAVGSVAMGISAVLDILFNFAMLLVIASVLISWVGADPSNPIVQFIERTTEPVFSRIRKLTSNIPGPFDWAPFITMLVLVFLQVTIIRYLRSLGH